MTGFALAPGSPAILYLQNPREKVWGLIVSVSPTGIVVRGLDIEVFDDWMRQQARGDETLIAPVTLFYPMHRVERMEADESVGPIRSYAERFLDEVGRSVAATLGVES